MAISTAEHIFSGATLNLWRAASWPISLIATRLVIGELRDIEPGSRILDVGVGTGITTAHLIRELPVTVDGVDASRYMLTAARKRLPKEVRLFHGDASHLPFEADTYDAAIYNYVLRYLEPEKTDSTLSEAARVVRPGGKVVITDLALPRLRPRYQPLSESIDARVLGIWSLFSKEQFREYMRRLGLGHVKTVYPPLSFMLVFQKG